MLGWLIRSGMASARTALAAGKSSSSPIVLPVVDKTLDDWLALKRPELVR